MEENIVSNLVSRKQISQLVSKSFQISDFVCQISDLIFCISDFGYDQLSGYVKSWWTNSEKNISGLGDMLGLRVRDFF